MATAADTVTADPVDEDDFIVRVQSFLNQHASPRTEAEGGADQRTDLRPAKSFQLALYEAGLAGLTWPREYGGQGLPGRSRPGRSASASACACRPY
jgi:alkylation response protein AidB-like acyl-CoA dehydrogenase